MENPIYDSVAGISPRGAVSIVCAEAMTWFDVQPVAAGVTDRIELAADASALDVTLTPTIDTLFELGWLGSDAWTQPHAGRCLISGPSMWTPAGRDHMIGCAYQNGAGAVVVPSDGDDFDPNFDDQIRMFQQHTNIWVCDTRADT